MRQVLAVILNKSSAQNKSTVYHSAIGDVTLNHKINVAGVGVGLFRFVSVGN